VANAMLIAQMYRKHWKLETLFQVLTENLCCEINTLGYPKAALFTFYIALVVYNLLSTIQAALRSVYGTEKIAGLTHKGRKNQTTEAKSCQCVAGVPPVVATGATRSNKSLRGILRKSWIEAEVSNYYLADEIKGT
jgi:hypothetical protein